MDFAGELPQSFKTRQADLALVVVVAETDAQLVRDRPFLDAADQQVDALFLDELGQFQRVRVVHQDRVFVAQLAQHAVIFAVSRLRSGQDRLHAQGPQGTHQRKCFERSARVDGGPLALQVLAVSPQVGQDRGHLVPHQRLSPLL